MYNNIVVYIIVHVVSKFLKFVFSIDYEKRPKKIYIKKPTFSVLIRLPSWVDPQVWCVMKKKIRVQNIPIINSINTSFVLLFLVR